MVTSKIETEISCETDSHICNTCNKKLVPKMSWHIMIPFLFIGFFYLILWGGVDMVIPDKIDPPFCYSEQTKNGITKRSFFECKF